MSAKTLRRDVRQIRQTSLFVLRTKVPTDKLFRIRFRNLSNVHATVVSQIGQRASHSQLPKASRTT